MSETTRPGRLIHMSNSRCETCGRKLPCEPCLRRAQEQRWDQCLDDVLEVFQHETTTPCFLVWFQCQMAMEAINRLRAEWPWYLEVVEPELPGDSWGARLARVKYDAGGYVIELLVTDSRIVRVDNDPSFDALGRILTLGSARMLRSK